MKTPALIASVVALALTIVPPILFLAGSVAEVAMKWTMLGGTLLWFLAWPLANQGSED